MIRGGKEAAGKISFTVLPAAATPILPATVQAVVRWEPDNMPTARSDAIPGRGQ